MYIFFVKVQGVAFPNNWVFTRIRHIVGYNIVDDIPGVHLVQK